MRRSAAMSSCILLALAHAQAPPKVVARSPADLACEVDATTTTVLVLTFDQPMQKGMSLCGGGPNFPTITQPPSWKDDRTLVVEVALEPDHDYQLGINCPAATNFRSRNGVPVEPLPWRFCTLPKELPDQKAQKQRNQKAFAELQQAIDAHYSYRDLRVRDWQKLYREGEKQLLAAKTDKGFAAAAAAMLQPTADLHLYVRCGERTFPTGTRAIDPLWRRELLEKYLKPEAAGKQALCGRTEDGIGYLLVGGWTQQLDLDAVERALASMRDCKAVVIDARPNSGGDESLARRVAAWFVDGKHAYAKNRYRVRPGKDGFGPVFDRSIQGNGADRRLDVPIAVLTSRYVMSSNESFVMMLQQAKDCTVVGQPTFGSSGNPKPFELGNGVTVVLPSWQDLRLDGSCLEGEGVRPDVEVKCTAEDLQQRDPILEQALAILRKKLAE